MDRTKTEVNRDNNSTGNIPHKKSHREGFLEFIQKNSIMALALGIIIGQTVSNTVNALVTGILTPTLQLLVPNFQIQDLSVKVGKADFLIGNFLNAFIQMLIILLLLYIVIGVLLRKPEWLGKNK